LEISNHTPPAGIPDNPGRPRVGLQARLNWYVDRLAAMSGQEILHRLEEQVKRRISRRAVPDFTAGATGRLPRLPDLAPYLAEAAAQPGMLEDWRAMTRVALTGEHARLGVQWPASPADGRWHFDPVTGTSWPSDRYCLDIDYRHSGCRGDVKLVWEINRLQHLQPVAALSAATGDTELAALCTREIRSWIEANPPFKGVNWASGIELALRATSLLTVTSLLPANSFDHDLAARLDAVLRAHAYWIMRFPSLHSSANNHRIAEGAGLYLIGTALGEGPEQSRWAAAGRACLIDECRRQILDDGVGAEQTPTYTAFSLELLMLAGVVADRRGEPLGAAFWSRVEAAGECLRWFLDADSNHPRIGDDDEGRVFVSAPGREAYVASVLGALSALRRRPDLAPPVVEPHLRHVVFGVPTAAATGPTGVRGFDAGGYTVWRWHERESDILLVFDHGPLGYLSIAAHGHADVLSIWLHVDGRPVLADAGTYGYGAAGAWRTHLRGTAAHNTLVLEGQNSSRIAGPFNWSAKAGATLIDRREGRGFASVEAEHDGYLASHGVRHRRRIERSGPEILVTDFLIGGHGDLEFEVGFLIHPDLGVKLEDGRWIVRDGRRSLLAIRAVHETDTGRSEAGAGQLVGCWYSHAFGAICPAPRLSFACRGRSAALAFTILPES
jgi:uncharacterized heparinase superfamily protein